MSKRFGIGTRPGTLAAVIQSGIIQRVFPVGAALPPTRQLAILTDSDPDAIRRELNRLVARELLESKTGRGGGYSVAPRARTHLVHDARG